MADSPNSGILTCKMTMNNLYRYFIFKLCPAYFSTRKSVNVRDFRFTIRCREIMRIISAINSKTLQTSVFIIMIIH